VSAGCAQDAYIKACEHCHFDENGKMDKSCYDSYQQGGVSCIATNFPIATAKHAAGQCPQIDRCTEQLKACVAEFNDYTDKEKCNGLTFACFRDADHCIASASLECGEKVEMQPCQAAMFLIFSVFVMFAGSSWLNNKR